LRAEPQAEFIAGAPLRLSRAPGRLDVMGGIADYTGSLVCEATLDEAAAVALQARRDRQVRVFSFNLFDEKQPSIAIVSLDTIAQTSIDALRQMLADSGNRWAGYLLGCVAILHERGLVDVKSPGFSGFNLTLLSTVPLGGGVSSSAAIEVAAMMNVVDHLQIRESVDRMSVAAMCQEVENRVVGAPCGIMDQVTSCAGQSGSLLRMICQPHELQPALQLPPGVRVVGINSKVKHSVGGAMYGKTRCAAFMAHRIILEKMRDMGLAQGATLTSDPMKGYLANLDPDDYKRYFRPFLPRQIGGEEFIRQFGQTIDNATRVEPGESYHVLQAADHHVLEARRVRNFTKFLEAASAAAPGSRERGLQLDKAGHLMYASHLSCTNDALLGAPECDLLVDLARNRESAGLYGAKITGGGSGGTVAVLCDTGQRADDAIQEIVVEYKRSTGNQPDVFKGSSPGAWIAGTQSIE
jgi:L-arabinokinase